MDKYSNAMLILAKVHKVMAEVGSPEVPSNKETKRD